MRFLILRRADEQTEAGKMPTERLLQAERLWARTTPK